MNKIYKYLVSYKIVRFIFSCISFFIRFLSVSNIPPQYLKNTQWYMNFDINDFFKTRKNGISWILRTKNGGAFLEKVILSCIDYIDEIIVIDNNSNDETKLIVEKLKGIYWKKIKYYFYPYKIHREDFNTSSIHSFAYYSN